MGRQVVAGERPASSSEAKFSKKRAAASGGLSLSRFASVL